MGVPTLFEEDIAPVRPAIDFGLEVEVEDDEPSWKGSAVVWGPAQTQGSKKGFYNPKLKRVIIVDDNAPALKGWRQELIAAMRRVRPAHPLDRPIAMHILVYVSRPMAHFRKDGEVKPTAPLLPAVGKDLDKIARAVNDAAEIAGWFCNDARICDLRIRRRYQSGLGERTWVWAWTLDRADQPRPELLEEEMEPTAPPDPTGRQDYVENDIDY
jgi:Holliday junction resolvase RusA-like endonuclease